MFSLVWFFFAPLFSIQARILITVPKVVHIFYSNVTSNDENENKNEKNDDAFSFCFIFSVAVMNEGGLFCLLRYINQKYFSRLTKTKN